MPDQPSRPGVVPYLYYEDVARMLEWLQRAFGFTARPNETLRDDEGRVVHAALDAQTGSIMIGSPGGDFKNPARLGQATQNLYVYVDDLEEHYKRAAAADAQMLGPIEPTFYGDRRYGVEDPEGHVWYFAVKEADLDASDWRPTPSDLEGH